MLHVIRKQNLNSLSFVKASVLLVQPHCTEQCKELCFISALAHFLLANVLQIKSEELLLGVIVILFTISKYLFDSLAITYKIVPSILPVFYAARYFTH